MIKVVYAYCRENFVTVCIYFAANYFNSSDCWPSIKIIILLYKMIKNRARCDFVCSKGKTKEFDKHMVAQRDAVRYIRFTKIKQSIESSKSIHPTQFYSLFNALTDN